MEDLNKLKYYLDKGVEIYENNSDSDSLESDEALIAKIKRPDTSNTDDEPTIIELSNEELSTINKCESEALKQALILNRRKKVALLRVAERLKNHLSNIREQIQNCKSNSWNHQSWHFKRNVKYRLGMPYFKEKDMYPCPYNADYYKMKERQEQPLQTYLMPKVWTKIDKTVLANTVYSQICCNKRLEVNKQIQIYKKKDDKDSERLVTMLENECNILENLNLIKSVATKWISAKVLSPKEINNRKNEIRFQIAELQKQMTTISDVTASKELTEEVVGLSKELQDIEAKNLIIKTVTEWDDKIDWLDVSCNAASRHSDVECKAMWEHYMVPKYSKTPWTNADNLQLTALVSTYNMENWDAISEEMGINKSAYQCCIHFFTKMWDKSRKERWNKDEEQFLISTVQHCRIGDFIPWAEVAKYFDDRNKSQVYLHYMQCLASELKKGFFTLSEDILLIALLKKYRSYIKASHYFTHRNISQLRDRFKMMGDNYRSWTFEDDLKILQHVEQCGEQSWAEADLDRNPSVIRHRYEVLKKWITKHPGESIENVTRRIKSKTAVSKYFEDKIVVNKTVNIMMDQLKRGEKPETVFSIKYVQKVLNDLGTKEKPEKGFRKPRVPKPGISDIMHDFFKYSYQFIGRTKVFNEKTVADTSKRVKSVLGFLGANLKIPDVESLENNPMLDEFDIEILKTLSENKTNEGALNQLCLPSTSRSNGLPTITTNLPPEPFTLIGFRGLMLHVPTLKNNASAHYYQINCYLPDYAKYPILDPGMKSTRIMIENQLEKIENSDKILEERELSKKRLKALFKWPAHMSSPYNPPPENPFSSDSPDKNVNLEPQTTNPPAKKKKGRPPKISKKVQIMLDAKKKRKLENNLESQENAAKKVKND